MRKFFLWIGKHRRLLLLLLFMALLVGATYFDLVHEAINQALEWAKPIIRHHDILGLALFVILSALSAIVFFFSTAVIIPVAVFTWGKLATMLLLWSSWMLGSLGSYWIGRHPGRRLAKWVTQPKKMADYEKKFSANASFTLTLLFQLAVPSEIPGYVLGALRYPLWKFLGAFAIAELPFAVGAVYLSDSFFRRNYALLLVLAVGAVIFSAVSLYFLRKRINR